MELLQWYNLIFVAPIGLAGLYLILSATGLGGHDVDTDADMDLDHDVDVDLDHDVDLDLDHDVDVDLDHDVDLDLDHDVDVDMDHDVDADLDHDVDVDHDVAADTDADVHGLEHEVHDTHVTAQQGQSLMIRALSVLGFGKVPVSILMTCLMVIFGAVGLVCNGLFANVLPWHWAPNVYFLPSFVVAIVASFSLTGTIARGLHRIMPTSETYAIKPTDLVGRVGTAVYDLKPNDKGVVAVKDEGGTLQRIAAQPIEGDIAKDKEVIIVRYHSEGDYYDVSESPL